MQVKKVLLCPNPRGDAGLEITNTVKATLERAGLSAPVFPVYDDIGTPVSFGDALDGVDMMICLGGDGTILHTSIAAAEHDIPILGINLGHLGFIADLEREDVSCIDRLLDGGYTIENRMMLHACVHRDGAVVYDCIGLNEAVITRGASAKAFKLTIRGDNRKISAFSGDGLIVATPTGSTAYSMSAGGPIVEPTAENFVLTPICPHAFIAKSFVLRGDTFVTVEPYALDGRAAQLTVDGNDGFPLAEGDQIRLTRARYVTRLVRVMHRSFFEIVNKKLTTEL